MTPVVIIPTLGKPHLRDAIESIDIPVRLCVIANGGAIPGYDFELLPGEDDWLIDLPHNIGYAAAVNLGIKCYPDEPYWIVMNDDVVLAPGDLQRLSDTTDYGWVGINDWSVQKLLADTVDRVGFMDENFHPAYADDCDYERRCDAAAVRWGFIKGETRHAGSLCLREHRADNARSYPSNIAYYQAKWGAPVRVPGGFATPFDRGTDWTPPLDLRRLRANRWRSDR